MPRSQFESRFPTPGSRGRSALATLARMTALVALATTVPGAGRSSAAPAPGPAPATTVPGVPRYFNYASPPGTGDDAGEPSLGINWTTEQSFSNSGGPIPNGGTVNYFGGFLPYMLKVTFNDCQSPAGATWDQKTLLTANTPRVFGDPILYTDRATGRTLVSQEEGLTPLGSTTDMTDDDGDTFLPTEGSGLPACVDHQTLGGGPFHAPLIGTLYPNAVYYASQCIANATCSLSLDGGVTFAPGVTMFTLADCVGLHGHLKVGPDGTVYVPNKGCGGNLPFHDNGQQAVAVSENNGLTWTVRPVTTSTSAGLDQSWDPSVAVASDGTVYFGYGDVNGRPHVAVSHDKGVSWINDQDVGASLGLKKCAFPAIVAGDPDRAAFAFYGTTTDGALNADTQPDFPGVWHLYIASTFDGGLTWTTQNATPGDPIQRGGICKDGDCRNMLDFFDAGIDREGRVLVGWDDGCIGGCLNGPPNSFTAKAVITRQSGGRRMFAAYDPVEPAVAGAPPVAASQAGSSVSLTWPSPDNGGATITAYRVYRRSGIAGPFDLVATVNETNFTDTVDPAGEFYYHVTAVNSQGEGPWCGDVLPASGPVASPCLLPGLMAVNDVNTDGSNNDSGQNIPPDPGVNVRQLFVAEPWLGPGVSELRFQLQLEPSTGSVPSSSQWYVIWNRRTLAADGSDRRYVAMKSDLSGLLSFEYGDFGPPLPLDGSIPAPNANTPAPLGSADSGSYDPATGVATIRLALSKADETSLVPGNDLAGLNVRTFLARPEGGPRSQNIANDITLDGSYTLVGNASCFVNSAPVARLVATPTSGFAPMAVHFDGSTSSDDDPGDGVASYTFKFGDGSDPVTQAGPVIDHTYVAPSGPGGYFATLTVNDQSGLQSLNVASEHFEVMPGPTPVLVSLVDTRAEPGLVKITWYAGDWRPRGVLVYRRDDGGEWESRGAVTPDGAGMIVYQDTEVTAGSRYGYRLGVLDEDEELFVAETWVNVPGIVFQLTAKGNPSHGRMDLTLALERDGKVRVGVFDVSGRSVASLVDDWMPAGVHDVQWDGRDESGRPAASGMYIVQARAGLHAVAARVMLIP